MDDGAEPAVEIRVRDEGAGIPEAYRQIIFEKYGRAERLGRARGAHQPRPRAGVLPAGGDVHGGAIWIDDQATGRGSCFCVRLPVARLPLGAAAAGVRR